MFIFHNSMRKQTKKTDDVPDHKRVINLWRDPQVGSTKCRLIRIVLRPVVYELWRQSRRASHNLHVRAISERLRWSAAKSFGPVVALAPHIACKQVWGEVKFIVENAVEQTDAWVLDFTWGMIRWG